MIGIATLDSSSLQFPSVTLLVSIKDLSCKLEHDYLCNINIPSLVQVLKLQSSYRMAINGLRLTDYMLILLCFYYNFILAVTYFQ